LIPAVAGVLLLHAGPAHAQKNLDAFAQPALKDLTAGVRVLSHNSRELRKIGKSFEEGYKLERQEISCKEPGMVRYQGKKGLLTLRYITNGNRRLSEVSTFRIRKNEDISKEPNKGETIADLGVITPAWVDRVESKWLRTEERGGKRVEVFQYWYKEDPRYLHTIVVDPTTKTIIETTAHHRSRKKPGFKKRFVYSEVTRINGVNLPQRVGVYNGENKLAAELRYEGIRVNTGLPDTLFKL
jgi:hypothetical protein